MTWGLWEIINVIRNQNWQRQWGNNEAMATSSWWREGKGRRKSKERENVKEKSSKTETVTEMLRKQLWTSICQLETKIECKALRHDVDVDVDGERWQSEAGAPLLLVAPDAVKANFGFNFCCIFVAFTELLLMLWRTEARAQSADRGDVGEWGGLKVKSS